jgi:hypothetical protein
MSAKVEILDNDVDGIQSVGQAADQSVTSAANALAERSAPPPPATAEAIAEMTPMQMAYSLIQRGVDLGSVKEMLAVSRELAAEQARRAFDAAIAEAKAEIPVVAKNAKGHNEKRYADFSAYASALKPILAKYGLSYRFRTQQTDKITVTCVLSHRDGHSEENSLSGPADASGSKNAIQAVGSTLTYLQRYTLIQALGLAAADDDDAKAASGPISEEQRAELERVLEECGADKAIFCEKWKVQALAEFPSDKLEVAIADVRRWFERQSKKVASR